MAGPVPFPCSSPDNLESHHPKPVGYAHNHPASQLRSLHLCGMQGPRQAQFVSLTQSSLSATRSCLSPAAGKTGWSYYHEGQPLMHEPYSGNTAFPGDPRTVPAWGDRDRRKDGLFHCVLLPCGVRAPLLLSL